MQSTKGGAPQKPLLQKAARHIEAAQYEAAKQAIEDHLKASPYDAQAWTQRALLLILTGQDTLSLDAASIALRIDNANADAWSLQGSALMQLGRFEEALTSYRKVVSFSPTSAVAHYNMGNALRRLGKLDAAIESIEISLNFDPQYTNALTVMGSLQQAKGNFHSAEIFYEAALSLNPNAADAHYNRGLLYLAKGYFAKGWQDYAWRLQWETAIRQGQSRSIDRFAPDWRGQATEKPILVVPEQGIGDQIFYGGMLADLQVTIPGSTVCLVSRLIDLFSRSFPDLRFVTPDHLNNHRKNYEGQFSAQIHLASLGGFFRNNVSDFQRVKSGYLKADAKLTAHFRGTLKQSQNVVCGLSWRSKNHEFGESKSLMLSSLAPLLCSKGVDFVDLQYGDTTDEINKLREQHDISLHQVKEVDNFHGIDSLASLINACDIVITVSNTTAHLAAALGKPVLVLLPNSPSLFWYWHLDRPDSPWYPSAVLLRQSTPGDWNSVIATAHSALREFVTASQH
jgi:Tfp pilus assembly protein PilF